MSETLSIGIDIIMHILLLFNQNPWIHSPTLKKCNTSEEPHSQILILLEYHFEAFHYFLSVLA